MSTEKANQVIAHANAVFQRLDDRKAPVQDAARRERQRLNASLKRRAAQIAVAVGVISLATIVIGLILPTGIGMFGFLAAVGLAIGIGGLIAFVPSSEIAAPSTSLPNGEMVQRFDS